VAAAFSSNGTTESTTTTTGTAVESSAATPADDPEPTAVPEPTDDPEPTAVPEPTDDPEPTAVPGLADDPEPTAVPGLADDPGLTPAAEEVGLDEGPELDAGVYDAPGGLELPLPLPEGAPGTIIDTEDITVGTAAGQRILYNSTSSNGQNIAVSGFVAVPEGEVPDGGWPLIAWAHGTTGLGDSCAPSNNAENDVLTQALLSFGYAVVATDYEGLGTPGTHPYVVGVSEARSVLDSVRAVYALELPVTQEWIVFGHSQGGHAAMFTGQLQPTYAPELNMIGVVAGAPPSQMDILGDSLIGGDFQGYLIMTAAGLVAADDQLSLSSVFSEQALSLIDVVETGCTSEIFEAYNSLDYNEVSVVDDPFDLPDWGIAIRANDTNLLPVQTPLLIIHGGEDEQIPVETSAMLVTQLCAFAEQGPTVRNVYEGQSHAGVLTTFAAVPDLLTWVEGRFAGEDAPDQCP